MLYYMCFDVWNYSKCWKSGCLKSKLFSNPNFCGFHFQTIRCLKSEQKSDIWTKFQISDTFWNFFCLKTELLGNWIVIECLQSTQVQILDTYCITMVKNSFDILYLCCQIVFQKGRSQAETFSIYYHLRIGIKLYSLP